MASSNLEQRVQWLEQQVRELIAKVDTDRRRLEELEQRVRRETR
jgi:hypothetical protein